MYKPSIQVADILERAYEHVQSVSYNVTVRWVFYRLLQEGILNQKEDYKRLVSYLSKARKNFYDNWRPDTLTDDTRAASIRGNGYNNGNSWISAVRLWQECNLDMWQNQPNYVEIWFEAGAMQAQFEHYANENITLLAFHGDISIPEKWQAAERIYERWSDLMIPIKILYYGDLDPKGLQIPNSAVRDILLFIESISKTDEHFTDFYNDFEFTRIGINKEHPALFNIPENPERPETYQWEGLDDTAAQGLIESANIYLDEDKFTETSEQAMIVTQKFRDHLELLEI